jgi:hypothetical protein
MKFLAFFCCENVAKSIYISNRQKRAKIGKKKFIVTFFFRLKNKFKALCSQSIFHTPFFKSVFGDFFLDIKKMSKTQKKISNLSEKV